jgi:hypothetical protein
MLMRQVRWEVWPKMQMLQLLKLASKPVSLIDVSLSLIFSNNFGNSQFRVGNSQHLQIDPPIGSTINKKIFFQGLVEHIYTSNHSHSHSFWIILCKVTPYLHQYLLRYLSLPSMLSLFFSSWSSYTLKLKWMVMYLWTPTSCYTCCKTQVSSKMLISSAVYSSMSFPSPWGYKIILS